MNPITIGNQIFSPEKTPLLIAGPCVIEDEDDLLRVAEAAAGAAAKAGFFYIFKASYLKDNRSSLDSYTGPGIEKGLVLLDRVKREIGVPVLTDVHCRSEVGPVAEVCDIIQVPAFLARQTRLIVEVSRTGKVVNLKKGQFLSPEDMGNVVEKARKSGAEDILVTERGSSFGYNDLVVDMTAFFRMRRFDLPLIFDVTHSLQLPGGLGDRSGGRPAMAKSLAMAAVAAGCDGLFLETHFNPLTCSCDAEVMLPTAELQDLLDAAARIFEARGE